MLDPFALSHQVPEDWRAQAEVFNELFFVFLAIGTIVGVVVVAYTLYHAYKSRDTGESPEGFEPPVVGELPVGQEGGKSNKLFLSFGISAILVISLVVYSYGLLLYVEEGPSTDIEGEEELEVEVIGIQFGWEFIYHDDDVPEEDQATAFNTLRVPQGTVIQLSVTSADVWHNFGVPELRIKADSIPGQHAHTWFIAEETGTYEAHCYELCGSGHSYMDAEIVVMEEDEWQEWYDEQTAPDEEDENDADENDADENDADDDENAEENENDGENEGDDEETNDRIAGPAVATTAAAGVMG